MEKQVRTRQLNESRHSAHHYHNRMWRDNRDESACNENEQWVKMQILLNHISWLSIFHIVARIQFNYLSTWEFCLSFGERQKQCFRSSQKCF